jgi:hypothetical protein
MVSNRLTATLLPPALRPVSREYSSAMIDSAD